MQRNVLRFPETMNPETAVGAGREEVALVARVAEGSSIALKELYEKRSGIVFSMLCRMLGDEMEAQECLQDVFVTIWRRASEFDSDRSSALAWMLMIARGKGWDRLRARARRTATRAEYEREVASLEVEIGSFGAERLERDELSAECAAALNELPADQSRALQMAFFRGWTHAEIARAVGEPLGTIKARIRRGLLALRGKLRDRHE